ncbi:MAG: beta-lactamase family protein [Actinomycetota bacterium]|nr:beta-lactamase family protein [Actinomycetota bacterium]
MDALGQVDGWPAEHVSVSVLDRSGPIATRGPADHVFRFASVTKLYTALAALVALEEGIVDLEDAVGPPGSTLRHLLAHASGLPMEQGPPIARPGERRIYSNQGFEVAAEHIAGAAEMAFAEYLRRAVFAPLGLGLELKGSPAGRGWALAGTLGDVTTLARELLAPTLVGGETLAEATSVQFPGLVGVLPSFGRQDPNDWGLGMELRDAKSPHWTGTRNSPGTFGHFGASGAFVWVDPETELALACLTDLDFGDWVVEAWPRLSDAVLADARR